MKIATVAKTTSVLLPSFALTLLTSSFESGVTGSRALNIQEPAVRTVVIDAGHGGKDPGCSGRHTIEKDIALSISLNLGELIKHTYPGVEVIFTRSTDVFVELDERAHIANKAKADLFISIHCNYISRRNHAQGSETYVMGIHRADDNLDVAKRENAAILMEDNYVQRYDGYDPDSPEGHIILSMYQNAFLEQSILFADFVEKQFAGGLARKSRGVKQAGFLVLRNTTMPSVLIETGFLSHDADEAYLGDKGNHDNIAKAIFKAFSEYKAHIEGYMPPEDDLAVASVVTGHAVPVAIKQDPPKPVEMQKEPPKQEEVNEEPAKQALTPQVSVKQAVGKEERVKDEITKAEPSIPAIIFFVQLAASHTPLTSAKWNVPVFVETKREDGYYKYLAGPFTEAGQASVLQKEVRAGCCKDAFVVAYRDNQRIPLKEAIASAR